MGKVRKPVEIYLLNADAKAMKDVFSMSVAAVDNFVRKRNDNFNFRDDICNLVVPGYIPQGVREKFEDIANTWGMLLINDLDDEKSFKNVERNFLPGGKYEFMKRPEDRAAADVVTMDICSSGRRTGLRRGSTAATICTGLHPWCSRERSLVPTMPRELPRDL